VSVSLGEEIWRRLKEERVGPLGVVGVGRRWAGAGQSSLDEDVQGDGRKLAGRLGGGAGGIGLHVGRGTRGGVAGWLEGLNPGRRRRYVGRWRRQRLNEASSRCCVRFVLIAISFEDSRGH